MPLTLRWRAATDLPVDGSPLKPETFRERPASDACRVALRIGNGEAAVGDLFEIEGDADDGSLILEGDLACVRRLGRGATSGTILVRGDVGPLAGCELAGGSIEIEGSAGDWVGAEMRSGFLRIRGDAGNSLAAAYPGSPRGMRDGYVIVDGSAGDDVGLQMRRGVIAVAGSIGFGMGRDMIAGTIIAGGAVGPGVGLGMKRGTLLLAGLGTEAADGLLSPTFAHAGPLRSAFLKLYADRLAAWGFAPAGAVSWGWSDRYNGDLAVGGQGEVLIPLPASARS